MVSLNDPVGPGLVSSLARPGGNITGTTSLATVVAAKRLELLKEAVPRLSNVLMLSYPVDPTDAGQIKEIERTAQALGVSIDAHEVRKQPDIAAALSSGSAGEKCAPQMPRRVPVPECAHDGALMFFAAQREEHYGRSAALVHGILKGAAPTSLPAEQPTKYDLTVSLKAARALGLVVPQSILARADELIE